MKYPTIVEVNSAGRLQLAEWMRFLDSPGMSAIGRDDFSKVIEREAEILNRIKARFDAMGGMTPQISKAIGWGKNEGPTNA